MPTQVDYVFIGVDFGRQNYMIDRKPLRWKDSTRVNLGGGEVTDIALQQLEKLTVTEQQAHPSAKIVWVVHYLPWVKREEDLPHYLAGVPEYDKLERSKSLLDAAARHNVGLIMCGHVHTHGDFIANKTTPVAVAASTGQWRSRLGPRMHLMDFPAAGTAAPTTIVDFEFRKDTWKSSTAWRSISV
jgi:hypothetical protein